MRQFTLVLGYLLRTIVNVWLPTLALTVGSVQLAHGSVSVTSHISGSAVLNVPRPAKPPTSGTLIMRNDSATTTVRVRVSSSAVPDLSNFERLLTAVCQRANGRSTHSLARAAYDLVSEYREYNWTSATIDDECHDPVKLLNVYGYGLCDDAARALATVWNGLGIPAAVWDLHCHVVPEYSNGKTTHALDPDMRVHAYIAGTSLTIPARSYHAQRHQLEPAEVADAQKAEEFRNRLVQALDHITSTPRPAAWKPVASHDAAIVLRPGESMVRFWSSELGFFSQISEAVPPKYANAIFTWERHLPPEVPMEDDLDALTIRSRLPFVLVNGWIEISPDEAWQVPPEIEVSSPHETPVPCPLAGVVHVGGRPAYRYTLPPEVRGAYELRVHLRVDTISDVQLPPMRYRQVLVTQCSPSMFPRVTEGDGSDTLFIETDNDAPLQVSVTIQTDEELVDDAVVLTDDSSNDDL